MVAAAARAEDFLITCHTLSLYQIAFLDHYREIDLGDATLLPGFIDLHAHIKFHHISEYVVLKHGITTVRDVGGAIEQHSRR